MQEYVQIDHVIHMQCRALYVKVKDEEVLIIVTTQIYSMCGGCMDEGDTS